MKILITGGNGYVAKSLYRALSNKYDVVSITRKDQCFVVDKNGFELQDGDQIEVAKSHFTYVLC